MWCETPRCRSRASASDDPHREDRRCRRARASCSTASAAARPPWPERGPGAHDPRPDRADHRAVALPRAQASAEAIDTAWTSPSRHGETATAIADQAVAPKRAHRVREGDRERAAGELDVGDAQPSLPQPRARRRKLAVERAADDRHPVERLRQLAVLLDVPGRRLQRRVGQAHHVGVRLRLRVEAASEVRVEDVEAARAERELPGLRVHDHVVADLDRAGEARVGDAGLAVDLEPDEILVALRDRRDGAPAEAKRHRRRGPRRRAPE